jgi:Family of unknown function (DUF6247)
LSFGAGTVSLMTAEPVRREDPRDPQVILRDLPERERAEFLRQYHAAVDAAHDPAGYQNLQRVLHAWSLAVVAANQPGYYEAIDEAKKGQGPTYPLEDAIVAEIARRV